MSSIKNFFERVWFFTGHLSKKAYTAGLIVFSGLVAVAVLFIGVHGFTGATSVAHVPTYEVEEEDGSEEVAIEVPVSEALTADEASIEDVEWAMTPEAEEVTEEAPENVLVQETSITRNFKSSGNVTEEAEITSVDIRDYTALLRIVEAEATGEDLKGKILIANVVLNRVNSPRFPDTIYDVVHQKLNGKAQFSPIDDGRYYKVPITESTEEAVEAALKGVDHSQGALFFVAKSLASDRAASWFDRNLEFLFRHGVHYFYKY